MSRYPARGEIVDVLAEVGRRAVTDDVTHPEDIVNAMTDAMEAAASTMVVLKEKGML